MTLDFHTVLFFRHKTAYEMRIIDWSSDVCSSDLGIVLHCLHFCGGAQSVRNALGGPLIVRGEAHADMAVVEDRVVGAVSLLDLIERLRDEECLQAVSDRKSTRLNSSH